MNNERRQGRFLIALLMHYKDWLNEKPTLRIINTVYLITSRYVSFLLSKNTFASNLKIS